MERKISGLALCAVLVVFVLGRFSVEVSELPCNVSGTETYALTAPPNQQETYGSDSELRTLLEEAKMQLSSSKSSSLRPESGTFFPELNLLRNDPFDSKVAADLASHFAPLLNKYKHELKEEMKSANEFSKHNREHPTIRCVGQIGVIEASMLYILIRESKPDRVLEVGALCGSSTRWMLAALSKNQKGALWTYDLHPYAIDFVGEHPNWFFFPETFCRTPETHLGS